jgi:hypothetical protein
MAETTDRPRGAEEIPSSTTAPLAAESYRPLSLLALAGFALAVVYALVVLVGGLVALVGRVPWLMPGWTFLLPLAALIVCWTAQMRIRASEDTLSGLAFTTWGFRLTIVLALTYSAYYAATFFTVRHQAIVFVDRVFEALKEGRTEQSFLLALGVPVKDVDDSDLRDMLEGRYNAPMGPPGTPGPYTRYRQGDFVRLIQQGGSATRIVPMGVVEWDYTSGSEGRRGYRVVLRYHIAAPLAEFEMDVETFGRESKPGEGKGRQWQIALVKGGMQMDTKSVKPTERGAEMMLKSQMAQQFATMWTEKINRNQWAEAYLDTLSPADRSRWHDGQNIARLLALAPLAGSTVFGLCDAACRDLLAGQQTLDAAKLIHIDKTFWTVKQQSAAIRQRIEQTFQASSAERPTVSLRLPQAMPRVSEHDGRITVAFDLGVNYMDESGTTTQYVVEGRLLVSAEGGDADQVPSAWRIDSLEMETGRTPPAMPRPGQPPPNAPGAGGPPQP